MLSPPPLFTPPLSLSTIIICPIRTLFVRTHKLYSLNQETSLSLSSIMLLQSPNNGSSGDPHRLSQDLDSGCSTPYVSAPSSPGRGAPPSGYFFSAPASPMHYLSAKEQKLNYSSNDIPFLTLESSGSFEFEFSSRFSPNSSTTNGLMSTADELFLNGQIRPMKLSSHLLRPQNLAPLMDLDGEEIVIRRGRDPRARNKSTHRKARSMSPLRNGRFVDNVKEMECEEEDCLEIDINNVNESETTSIETTPSCSASSSRSSSSGRNSKKWIFLKDLLHRSKSEGRATSNSNTNSKERFWSNISFSPKEKKSTSPILTPSSSRDGQKERGKQQSSSSVKKSTGKPANGVSKRRVAKSAHELHYTTNRAQAEEMKRKTFLPYRQGLLGCLGFSSKGYGALNGLTKSLNPISSR